MLTIIRGEVAESDGYQVEVIPGGWEHLQTGTCPDCGGTWVWAEAGSVPGARKCTTCGSQFMAEPCGRTPEGCIRGRVSRLRTV
jgi:ribosomal protein S27AE